MQARRLSRLSLFAAAAVAAYVFESVLPTPVPWARIGLSNIFVVVTLFAFGLRDAFLVNIARVLAGNLLMGFALSPALLFSLAGSTSSLLVMAIVRLTMVPPLSVIGASCLGATTSNVVQVLLFTSLFAATAAARDLMGGFILLGVVVGFITGLVASGILRKVVLERTEAVD